MIIENDQKVRAEILRYIRELAPDSQPLVFASSSEFEQRFLLAKAEAAKPKVAAANPIEGITPELIKKMHEYKFSNEPPFPGDLIAVDIKQEDFSVQKTNILTGQVFGDELVKTFMGHPPLEKFIHPDFLPAFEAFKKLEADKHLSQSFAFRGVTEEVWMIEVEGQYKDGNGHFQLRNKTRETLKLLGMEIEKTETPPEPTLDGVDVVLFRQNCIDDKDVQTWVTKVAAITKKLNLWPAENRPKFIAIRFEDDKKERAEMNHPFIDDIFCLPFDRLIFLQKLELIMKIPEKTTPSYLFVQETLQDVEVAKKVSIEKFSDLGFAMANPVPLGKGTAGHFYFRFPGQKALLNCYAKVTHCLPHPEREKEYLAYFAYFGLSRDTLKEIRGYLNRDTGYKMLIEQDPREFEYNPDNIFLREDQKRMKTVVVIDTDEKTLENVTSILKKDIGGLNVITDNSYFNFFRNHLSTEKERVHPATADDLYSPQIAFLVGVGDMNLQMVLTPPKDGDKLFGHDAPSLFASPQGWFELFKTETSRNLVQEAVFLIQGHNRLRRSIEITSQGGEKRTAAVEFILEENRSTVRINMGPPPTIEAKAVERINVLDAILIDRKCISGDTDAFVNGLKDGISNAGVKCPADGPKVILMGEEQKVPDTNLLVKTKATGLVFKPLEVKRLCYALSSALDVPFTPYRFDNIGWKPDVVVAKLARDAHMVELSEFGATIRMNQKLKIGSMFYMFKSIFQNAPDNNLCCRVYHSAESEEDGLYLNYVSYFGITDAFLKYTRSYIRETYADKKSKGAAE